MARLQYLYISKLRLPCLVILLFFRNSAKSFVPLSTSVHSSTASSFLLVKRTQDKASQKHHLVKRKDGQAQQFAGDYETRLFSLNGFDFRSSSFSNDDDFENFINFERVSENSTHLSSTSEGFDLARFILNHLAQWSLADYAWRSSVFQAQEAERMIEESMARMLGETHAPYVRPMDAEELGPLGRLEKSAVTWLYRVMEEEGRRAEKIVQFKGNLVRPIDVVMNDDAESFIDEDGNYIRDRQLGPLGILEKTVVDFINSIRTSESERVRTQTWRPKDLDQSKRGPLGRLEDQVASFWESLWESEHLRAELSRSRQTVVRPIDVPGPLGEIEMAVTGLIQAEQRRSAEREKVGKIVRPKDARWKGPLGELEQKVYGAIQAVNAEEMERLRNIRRVLQEKRPMETQQSSFLGWLEAFVVGLIRAPHLIMSVNKRVKELMASELLIDKDLDILDDNTKHPGDKKNI